MNPSKRPSSRPLVTGLAIISALFLVVAHAQAKPGVGGSRGTRTTSAPPTTNTAPNQAQPLPGAQTPRTAAPAAPSAPAAAPSRWNGLMGGLAGGLIGAGLFGLLAGNGLSGGLGSMMSILGLLLQVGIVFFIIRFAIGYFRRKSAAPAMAGGPANFAPPQQQPEWQPAPAAAQPAPAYAAAPPQMPALALADADFGTFERLLGEIQMAFGKEDRIILSQRATPEMANIFNDELNDLARKGFASRVSDVKLLQGDLSEAWREPNAEYATVAMRYAITDVKVERASGRIVEGDPKHPQEIVELWTFVRAPGGTERDWVLSAIQEA